MSKLSIFLAVYFLAVLLVPTEAKGEFRSAKEMQNECRVALQVFQGSADNAPANALLAGECVGYIQGAVDASIALAENVSWYKVCVPDNVSTQGLIQMFIAFADANPKYTLASTAIQVMLGQAFPCKK